MRRSSPGRARPINVPTWIKVGYSVFIAILVPVYLAEYGPKNFLWTSDIALLVTLLAIWLESRVLASMMAVAVLVPDVLWIVDFAGRLSLGPTKLPLLGTQYMFDDAIPLLVRLLSLFHVFMPVLLIWLVLRLGYDPRAWLFQSLLACCVLPLTYLLTEPPDNINWVYGIGAEPQDWMPAPLYVATLMALVPICVYWPTHRVLRALYRAAARPKPDTDPNAA